MTEPTIAEILANEDYDGFYETPLLVALAKARDAGWKEAIEMHHETEPVPYRLTAERLLEISQTPVLSSSGEAER